MRYLILSDIHGNWEALEAVLASAGDETVDQVLVLGDLVGYGGGPNEVVDAVRRRAERVVRGNHDKVVAKLDDGEGFNSVALAAARWTTEVLSDENLSYLRDLDQGPVEIRDGVNLCHGSPLDEDEYVVGLDGAEHVFAVFPGRLTFFGHTHLPMVFVAGADGIHGAALEGEDFTLAVDPENRYLVNPGSVGQPRDRNPQAGYLIYDSERGEIRWRRCDYELEKAQRRILDAGLPQILAYRLAAGI